MTITDNGTGIKPERLAELNQILESDDALLSEHIGIRNVHNRIRLKYGNLTASRLQASQAKARKSGFPCRPSHPICKMLCCVRPRPWSRISICRIHDKMGTARKLGK
ncbi:hypothetical protein P4H66_30015 [Paenibacillus dokdonensis]|uniref:Uncharacterized protein n=1 Tax=Paenibacillus dokdonensis TaxID=2567944 RepID=A0ABU6GWG5_9BACL|nr:hypothetical protein [Paenibacillus dokdonensis]MEC0244052.1 hypothetical protein [Paenibacillus dokdonensis]